MPWRPNTAMIVMRLLVSAVAVGTWAADSRAPLMSAEAPRMSGLRSTM